MATVRRFSVFDMLEYNNVNLDILTETFNTYFYCKYILRWPEYCVTLFNMNNSIQAYLMGKVEGDQDSTTKKDWHGHVTAVTVAPQARKQGLAYILMNYLEKVTIGHKGWFVDLFVRPSNKIAVKMYKSMGYDVYRAVDRYYSSLKQANEDAYDMRKSMPRDTTKETSKPLGIKIKPSELQFN